MPSARANEKTYYATENAKGFYAALEFGHGFCPHGDCPHPGEGIQVDAHGNFKCAGCVREGTALEAAKLQGMSEDDARALVEEWGLVTKGPELENDAAPPSDGSNSEAGISDRETAARLAGEAVLFHTPDDEAFATIDVGDHAESAPVRSQRFKGWLTLRFRAVKGKAPSTDALSVAQTEAEAKAQLEGIEREIFTRVGHTNGRVYLDLCDEKWRAVEIDGTGWRVVDMPPVKFRRAKDARKLPVPVPGGFLEELRPFVNFDSEDDWRLMVAWLVGAMMPTGPYPLLALHGEQGSAKSSTSRRLRQIMDPARTETRSTPKNEHDLAIAASKCWVLVLDNLSGLRNETSDALCRLATGGGIGTRELYSTDEEKTFYAKRPVVLNGIGEIATRGDLLSRSIVLQLPNLDNPRDERELDAEFEVAWPSILGALLTAVSTALARWDSTHLERSPRMADFARWVEAAAPALGWKQGEFLGLYAGNRTEASQVEIAASLVGPALVKFAKDRGGCEWKGRAGELLEALNQRVRELERPKGWPQTGKAMGDHVRRLAPALREEGIEVSFQPHGRKLIFLRAPSAEHDAAGDDRLAGQHVGRDI